MVVVTVTDRSDMPNSARRRFRLIYPFMSSCQIRLVAPVATSATGVVGKTAQPLPLEPAEL